MWWPFRKRYKIHQAKLERYSVTTGKYKDFQMIQVARSEWEARQLAYQVLTAYGFSAGKLGEPNEWIVEKID